MAKTMAAEKKAEMRERAETYSKAILASIKPFNGGEGYEEWSYDVLNVLEGKGLLAAVEQDITRGQRGEALKEAELMDKMTKGLLHACTGSMIKAKIRQAKTAYEAWKNIKGDSDQANEANVFRLNQTLMSIKYGGGDESLERHLSAISQIVEKIKNSGGEVKEDTYKMAILSSLPEEYDSVKVALQVIVRKITVVELQEQLLIQEAEMKRATKGSTSVNVNGAALAVGFGKRMQGKKCYNCGELGHIKPHCKKSMKQDTRKCYACGGKGHIGDVCPSMRNRDDGDEKKGFVGALGLF